MTKNQRYYEIKKICESKNLKNDIGQLPSTESDLLDEFSRFDTTLEPTDNLQDSDKWQNKFLQNLIFGTS